MVGYGQLILALSILVLLHELGHFLPAKWFKMRVDKFYLFFNPWFSLFKFKKGGTEYGIGWLPLGGYVKIAGMIDESMDSKGLELPAQPWEFRSKPAWQRLIVMLGGVTVNIILAWVIFSGVTYYYGEEYLPAQNNPYGVYCDPSVRSIGFENEDKVVAVDGVPLTIEDTYSDISWGILMNETKSVTVDRNGKEVNITIPDDIGERVMANDQPRLFSTSVPFIIDSVVPNTNAYFAGLKQYDRVVGIDGEYIGSFDYGVEILRTKKGGFVDLTISRSGSIRKIKCYVSSRGTLGVWRYSCAEFFKTETKTYSFIGALGRGADLTLDMFVKNILQLKLLFNKNGTKHVGSVLSMKDQYGEVWDWYRFWFLTANLSLVLAFFNVLPIPGLDGGHAIFLFFEMVTRKKPSVNFMKVVQTIGMILLLTLMFFALGNDIYNGKF